MPLPILSQRDIAQSTGALQRRRLDGALQRLALSPVAPVGPGGQQNDDRARNRGTAQYDRQRLFLDMTQPSESNMERCKRQSYYDQT
jgi:hypothetical protein